MFDAQYRDCHDFVAAQESETGPSLPHRATYECPVLREIGHDADIAKARRLTHFGTGVCSATVEVGIGALSVIAVMVINFAHYTPRLKISIKTRRSDQELNAGFK
jgi:hypothetical protein